MKAIFKKELRSLFLGTRAYAFIAINLLFTGIFTYIYNFYSQSPKVEYVLSLLTLVTALSLPIITTSIFIKERKSGTEALLLSLPLSSRDVVLGKYLATLVAATPTVFVVTVLAIIFSVSSSASIVSSIVAAVGYILFYAAVSAILIFIDSVSKSCTISLSASYATVIVAFLMGIIPDPTKNVFLKAAVSALKSLALFEKFDHLVTGFVDAQAILYYVCAIVLFTALTVFFYKRKRNEPYSAPTKATLSVFLAALLIIICIVPALIPSSLVKYDITENRMYSISDRTKTYLGELDENVTIHVINADGSNVQAEYILELMNERSGSLNVIYETQEALSSKLLPLGWDGTSAIPAYSLLISSDKRSSFLSASNMYFYYNANFGTLSASDYSTYGNMLYQYAYQYMSGQSTDPTYYNAFMSLMNESLILYQLEGATLNAIEYVTLDVIPTTYYITGLGDDAGSAVLISTLVQSGFKTLSLEGLDSLPNDASCIIINAPTRDLTDAQRDMIRDFKEASGGIIFLLSEENREHKNLMSLLDNYGIKIDESILVTPAPEEPTEGETFNEQIVYAYANEAHESVYALAGTPIPFVNASNISVLENYAAGVTKILTTSSDVFVKSSSGSEGEKTIAVSVVGASYSDKTRPHTAIIATGADSFNNENITVENFNFVISAIDWCSESYTPSISDISPVLLTQAPLVIGASTGVVVCVIISAIIPIALIAIGVAITKKRKSRKPAFEAE